VRSFFGTTLGVGVFGAGVVVVVAVLEVLDALPLLAEPDAPDVPVFVLEPVGWASVALDAALLEPVVFVPEAVVVVPFAAGVVVVAAGVVVVAALCETDVALLSLPQPAKASASTTPVVTVNFRGTRRTIAPATSAM
jgi:hypothetical protein